MARSSFFQASTLLSSFLALANAQSSYPSATPTTSAQPVFTIPASADEGADVLPNILDPQAVNAQDVCPGYKASQFKEDERGVTAILSLAGAPCNVYGNDIESLNLKVEYQSKDRLAVNIRPTNLDASNSSHWIVPEHLIPRPQQEDSQEDLDLQFAWGNEPSFWFTVTRKSSGDVIFTTKGTHLVYEDQFVEFVNSLPEDYNLYGLGERIHGLKLNNNFTATIYAADVGDPIDRNIYGSHPFYLETRYFEAGSGKYKKPLKESDLNQRNFNFGSKRSGKRSPYESASHGVYYRNTHGMDVKLSPTNLTWRTLGGEIDLFFFDGPTQHEVTKQYQKSAVGLPAMQSYWTLGFHQCRWGYRSWAETKEIVETMRAFDIPMGKSNALH